MYANTMTITLNHLSIANVLIEDLATSSIPSRGLTVSERVLLMFLVLERVLATVGHRPTILQQIPRQCASMAACRHSLGLLRLRKVRVCVVSLPISFPAN